MSELLYGECAKHPGNLFTNCSACAIEELTREPAKDVPLSIREQAERGIALREKAGDYELWLPKQNVPFIKYAFHTYRPLAEAYLALRTRHEKLREAALAAYRSWHHECDLDELGAALAADDTETGL